MKRFITTCVFIISMSNCLAQQILVKLTLEDKYKVGYGVVMYYLLNNTDELKNSINSISKFNEREILNALPLPLAETIDGEDSCETTNPIKYKNFDFIQNAKSITIEKSGLNLTIAITYAFVDYCIFKLYNKYWGSYDVSYKKAAVIKNYKMSNKKISASKLNEIKKLINNIN